MTNILSPNLPSWRIHHGGVATIFRAGSEVSLTLWIWYILDHYTPRYAHAIFVPPLFDLSLETISSVQQVAKMGRKAPTDKLEMEVNLRLFAKEEKRREERIAAAKAAGTYKVRDPYRNCVCANCVVLFCTPGNGEAAD